MGQQRHPAVPRISGCRVVPPSPTHRHTHTRMHKQSTPTPPHHVHKQTSYHVKNTNSVTPTKQQYSNMHMSKDCLSGNTAHSNKCVSLESFIQWEKIGKKLEKAAHLILTKHKHSPKCCLTKVIC